MLHWPAGAEGRGALLSGDIIQVAADRKSAGFMRSYPNWIPLGPNAVRRIAAAAAPFAFERVYGAWWDRAILSDGKAAVDAVGGAGAALAGGVSGQAGSSSTASPTASCPPSTTSA